LASAATSAVFAALSQSLATLEEVESGTLSEYLSRSVLLRLHDALRETLSESGLPGLLFAPARLETESANSAATRSSR